VVVAPAVVAHLVPSENQWKVTTKKIVAVDAVDPTVDAVDVVDPTYFFVDVVGQCILLPNFFVSRGVVPSLESPYW